MITIRQYRIVEQLNLNRGHSSARSLSPSVDGNQFLLWSSSIRLSLWNWGIFQEFDNFRYKINHLYCIHDSHIQVPRNHFWGWMPFRKELLLCSCGITRYSQVIIACILSGTVHLYIWSQEYWELTMNHRGIKLQRLVLPCMEIDWLQTCICMVGLKISSGILELVGHFLYLTIWTDFQTMNCKHLFLFSS